MPITDVGQIAASAIETALAVVRSTGEITEARAVKLLHALEADLSEAWQPGSEVRVMDRASFDVDGKRVTLDELITTYREAVTKTVDGEPRPAGDFLVVEDSEKVDTWHLPVKVNGEPNHNLMGAAKAALTSPGGHRGNVYKGSDKIEAVAKLKSLYKSENMEWVAPTSETEVEEIDVEALRQTLLDALALLGVITEPEGEELPDEETTDGEAEAAEPGGPEFCICPECSYETEKVRGEPCRAMECPECGAALVAGTEVKPKTRAEEVVELCESATFGEVGRGYAVNFIEAEANSPAYIDLVPVKAGWGNKKDNHYYDLPMLRECAHVWKGAKMWPSDHRQDEKNALNQVTEVVESPIGFTEKGEPIVRAVILSAEFEDVARRRQEAGILHTLQNSILGTGTVRKKPFERGGRKGKYVESIKAEKANIDWVTSAGAGGHAVGLAESNEGGDQMSDEQREAIGATETETEQVEGIEEVTLVEGEQEQGVTSLAEKDVETALAETNLPPFVKTVLAAGEYTDEGALQAAIAEAIAEVKKLTGSGQVFGQGETEPVAEATFEEREQARTDRFNRRCREVGIAEV